MEKSKLILTSKSILLSRNSKLPPCPATNLIAKADSGASQHYIPLNYKDALIGPRATSGPTVHLADDTTIQATAVGTLPLDTQLSPQAREAHVFKELTQPLLSLGQLCDDDCDIIG